MTEKAETHRDRAHHPDSPSSLQASEACPKFENEQRDSPAADKGTLQHTAAETRDLEILDGDPAMIDAVSRCLAYEDTQREILQTQFPAEIIEEVAEEYLAVGDDRVGEFVGITGGYADKVLRAGPKAVVLDWKFGRIPVTPTKDNLQGIAYALGVFQRFPQVAEVEVHFFAPYQGWSEQEQLDKYVGRFRREQVVELELRIRTVVARKHSPTAQPSPRDDLCIWCARKGDCAVLHSLVLVGASKYPMFTVPTVVDPLQLSTQEQVERGFVFASQVESIAKAIKRRCVEMVLREEVQLSDRVKLVKRVERQLSSLCGLFRVARRHGVSGKELFESLTAAITKVEEKVKAKAPRGQGAAKIRAFQEELRSSGVVTDSAPVFFLQEAKAPAEKLKPVIELSV